MQLDPANPSFTLQAWVKFSGNPAGRQVFFYSNGPGGAISFSVNIDRTIFVTTLGILDASSQAAIPDDGAWHHIAVVHENGVELRYYVDGVLGHTRPYTSGVIFTRTQNFFTVGAEGAGGLQYIGALDRLKVTSGILTPAQLDFKAVPAGAGDAPIKKGLVAYWNFENNYKDQAGKFDGTPMGTAAIPFVTGKSGFGKSIKLDGEDQYVEITGGEPDDLAFAGGSVSIAGWFKVGTFDTSWQALVAKGEGSNWRVARRGTEGGIAYAGGLTDTPTGKDVNDGNWHHFVAISDSAGVDFGTAMYVDGVRDTVIAGAAALVANGSRVMIGENPGARSREWEGELDDIAIWSRVLTEAEIGQLYNKGAGKQLSELLGAIVGDSDKDGIPDEAEKLYGFNPNDPTDAAKDFDKDGVSNLDEYKAGTDPVDVFKPTIAAAASSASFDKLTITFSEELDPATATVAANYSISPALAVTAATYNRKVVTLTTAKQAPGATAYTVTVKGVKDTSKNEIAADAKVVVYSYMTTRTGVLKYSYWSGITGTPVDNLLSDANYPANPTGVGAIYSFNSRDFFPTDSLENYGAVMEGYLTPTESAAYRFFVYSDDASQLFLSTDDKEANLAQIAEETGCCNNFTEPDSPRTSEPINLVAGRKYFVRLIYKEGGGGDYGQVAWRKEGDKTPAGTLTPIKGQFLSAAVDLPVPAEGGFATQAPATNAKNVKPASAVTIAHRDGKTEWTAANVTLKFDGVAVKPIFTKVSNLATISYQPASALASKSSHSVSLDYVDAGGKPANLSWSFEVAEYKGPLKDVVKGYEALIFGGANLTADKGGFSGKAGDLGLDFGRGSGQSVLIADGNFLSALNAATASDQLTFSLWIKKYDTANNSAFWADSPGSNGTQRGYQAHAPWSDNNIYFDTAGCCDGTTQRISAGIDTFPGFTGDISWWTNSWHHFAFTKKAAHKQVWIDGVLFMEGDSTNPLPTDFTRIWLGAQGGGPDTGTANNFHGLEDDFAVFGTALADADVKKLATGSSPTSLAATTKLIGYWDFNSLPVAAAAKFTKAARNADGSITLEWTGGGTLEAAASVIGPWQAVPGATSPYKLTPAGAQMFGRIKQ